MIRRRSVYQIINDAAQAYRGVIPADRWNESYMPREELEQEISQGVRFSGIEADGILVGVMGYVTTSGSYFSYREVETRSTAEPTNVWSLSGFSVEGNTSPWLAAKPVPSGWSITV